MEKECICCKLIKPIADYYKHSQMKDGHLNKCKECQKINTKNARDANPEHYKDYDRNRANLPKRVNARKEYSLTDQGKDAHRRAHKKQKEMYPNKAKTRYAVSNAVRDGRLFKSPCEVCGKLKVEAHHPDYSKPLDVMWLCTKHHKEWHKNNIALNSDS